MRCYGSVLIAVILACGLAGCGSEQPPPPADVSQLPPNPMAGVQPTKESLKKGANRSGMPTMPGMLGPGSKK